MSISLSEERSALLCMQTLRSPHLPLCNFMIQVFFQLVWSPYWWQRGEFLIILIVHIKYKKWSILFRMFIHYKLTCICLKLNTVILWRHILKFVFVNGKAVCKYLTTSVLHCNFSSRVVFKLLRWTAFISWPNINGNGHEIF